MAADSSDASPEPEEKKGQPFPLLPLPNVNLKAVFTSWDRGVRFIGNNACCCSFMGLFVVTLIVCLGMATLPLKVETDFESFMMTDVHSSLMQQSFDAAMDARNSNNRRLQATTRRLQGVPRTLYTSQDLFLYYVLKPEFHGLKGGIFHSQAINEIAKFEKRLRNLPAWWARCSRTANTSRGLCDPGMSFVRYSRPTLVSEQSEIVPVEVIIDGEGYEPVSTRTAVLLADQQKMRTLLFPKDTNYATDEEEPSSTMLRSAFRFRLPVGTSANSQEERRIIKAELVGEWEAFFRETIAPFVREGTHPDGGAEKMLEVWYDGTAVKDIEVKAALSADTHLAAMSMVYVLLYLFYHTRSPVLAVLGPVITIIAVPLSFVICAVIFGTTTLSFANFIAVFLVVGFGADVMLVYTDFWEASGSKPGLESYPDRLVWTYSHAIRSTTTTTGTTALAFLANLASVIRALRHFGFFMGLCIVLAWFLISFIYAPLLVVTTKYGLSFRRNNRANKDKRMTRYVRCLYRFRRSIFIIAVVASALAIGIAGPQIKRDDKLPTLFPPDHNQNKRSEADNKFSLAGANFGWSFKEPPRREKICESLDKQPAGCVIFWCDADSMDYAVDEPWAGEGECRCFRKEQEVCDALQTPSIRFVGTSVMHKLQLQDDVTSYIGEYEGHSTRAMRIVDKGSVDSPTTLFQEWETGMVSLQAASRAEIHFSGDGPPGSLPCAEYLCFCRGAVCKMDSSWEAMSKPLKLSYFPPSDRRLAVSKPSQRIYIALGLTAITATSLLSEKDSGELWSYRKGFDMSQPWVQRNIYALCAQLPAKLKVKTVYCWMKNLREYVVKETGRFPVRSSDFKRLSEAFIASGSSNTRNTRYLWKVGDDIKAMYASIHVYMDRHNVDEVLGMMEVWDAHISRYNSKAVKAARGAYHVSEAWVRAEAASQLLLSMLNTLLILFVLAFVAMNLFTHSCILAVYVVISTISVLCGLCFFIVVINGWDFGLVEVISLIYFIGYALDYSLHIAYKYSAGAAELAAPFKDTGSEASNVRLQRVEFALRSIGGAVFGSALTTIGASFFLLFCNLTLFRKLGAMCLCVSLLSVFVALLPLPASLMIFGPQKPGCRCLDVAEGPDSQFSSVSPARSAVSRE